MTPEKALGRLINLREQLTDKQVYEHDGPETVLMSKDHYSVIVDDLDDIIRSIQREMNQKFHDAWKHAGRNIPDSKAPEEAFDLDYPEGPDNLDSEDTERRRKR